ncbi:helix-turn-helix domain-containing protein [Actinoallomurus sp. CA-142502]|uniref:helix-turn-helix domain-containing protein n=1 Tax=Actinoallomurus sp. CA-142502 TaxID=3239885 RepID=UPI003D90D4F6
MHDVSPVPDDLLKPREVAELFGVRTTTIARWAREGKLSPLRTPGGHRRYSRADIRRILAEEATPREAAQQIAEDAVRLYNQGWSIRQVAGKFDYSYGAMRRLLGKHVTLRNRGGFYADIYPEDKT